MQERWKEEEEEGLLQELQERQVLQARRCILYSKANLAGTTPNDEHADVQDSSATRQDKWSDDNYFWDSTYGAWCYYEQWDTSQNQWNYYVAQEGWNRRTDHHCLEETAISPFGAMLAIIFFLEFLLHQLSLAIGYAKYFVCQIRLHSLFVSQQFSTLSVEFEQLALPFAMDFLRNLFKNGFSIFSKDLFLKLPHQLELWDEDTPLRVFLKPSQCRISNSMLHPGLKKGNSLKWRFGFVNICLFISR